MTSVKDNKTFKDKVINILIAYLSKYFHTVPKYSNTNVNIGISLQHSGIVLSLN